MGGVRTVGRLAFYGTGLRSFVWPTGAPIVPEYCFDGASSLTSITNLGGVDTIRLAAFARAVQRRAVQWCGARRGVPVVS